MMRQLGLLFRCLGDGLIMSYATFGIPTIYSIEPDPCPIHIPSKNLTVIEPVTPREDVLVETCQTFNLFRFPMCATKPDLIAVTDRRLPHELQVMK